MRALSQLAIAAIIVTGFSCLAAAQSQSNIPPSNATNASPPTGATGDFGGGVSGYPGSGASGTSITPGTRTPDSAVNDKGQATGFGGTNTPDTATTDPSTIYKPVAPQVSGPNRKS